MIEGQIAKGAIISYIAIILNLAITFFYTPWMIRQIGMSDYGLYSLVCTFIAYFIIDFGLSGAIQRFIAKYLAEGKQSKVENMIGLTMKAYLCIDVVIFIILFICFFFLKEIFTGLTGEEIEKLKILYVLAGLFSVFSFVWHPMNGAMMAYEYFVENKLMDMFHKVGTVVLIIVALLLNGDVYALVFINGAMGLLTSIIKCVIFKRKSKICVNWQYFERNEMKNLLSFSVWVFLTSLAQRLRLTMMPTVLGILANSTEISIFSLGMTIEAMTYIISSALNGLFLPKVTRMLTMKESGKELTDLMIRVGRLQLYVISLVIMGFWLIGSDFLNLWVGENFHNSYYVVILLTIFNMVSLTQRIAEDVVYAEDKVRYTATLTFVSSALSLIGSVILAPSIGAVGCALAFSIAMTLNVVWLNVFYKHELHLEVGRFFCECHGKILPLLFMLTLISWGIKKMLLPILGWGSLILFASLYTLIFLFVSYVFLFNRSEKELIQSFIAHK
jgi:O-antigen/teichoic acid export membrane protein